MQLTIDGQPHTFIPLPAFRQQWGLPEEFSLAYFEPKDWQGLGTLDGSGKALAALRQRMLEAVPVTITLAELIFQAQTLADRFHTELTAINPQIGLREVEVEFAVAGLADVLQSVAYQLVQLSHTYRHDPSQVQTHFDFSGLYQNWLDASVRVSATTQIYAQQNATYQVRVIYNPYGRVGLKVEVAGEVYYVTDLALACPALHYMQDLCGAMAQALCTALTRSMLNV
ncbi:MAG: hypothetical protein BroJett011_55220 [Chloroflexota bacterium]|nr:MAG: hypothetical protein BroJett011_55220 [Chloroflexota bacterium]